MRSGHGDDAQRDKKYGFCLWVNDFDYALFTAFSMEAL